MSRIAYMLEIVALSMGYLVATIGTVEGGFRASATVSGHESQKNEGERHLSGADLRLSWPSMGDIVGSDGAPMELVPAGEFLMGSPGKSGVEADDEVPQHRVYLDAFYIDKYEVTNWQYRVFVKATEEIGHRFCLKSEGVGKRHLSKRHDDSDFNGSQQPVVDVTWHDAYSYCAWAGKRLPREAEWEKAARGSDGRIYPWGDELARGPSQGNFAGSTNMRWSSAGEPSVLRDGGYKLTAPVGSFPKGASPFGVMDMSGNVWEWVEDWYDPRYYEVSPTRNPKGPESGRFRVLRGGSWDDLGIAVRTANRGGFPPTTGEFVVGFRCAQDARP